MPTLLPVRFLCSSTRTLFLGALLLGAASVQRASAQTLSLTVAGSLNAAQQPALSLGVTLRNVSIFGGYGLSTRLLGDLGRGGGLDVSGLIDWPLASLSERLTLYGGPGLALTLGPSVRLRPSLTAGLTYDLNGQVDVFGEVSSQLQGHYRLRSGVSFSF